MKQKLPSSSLHIVFYASDKPREHMLAKALQEGVQALGDTFTLRRTAEYGETPDGDDRTYPGPDPETDVAVCFGVKGRSRDILRDHLAMGKSTLFIDKGYSRESGEGGHTLYSRISVNGSNPLHYMMEEDKPSIRWSRLNIHVSERRKVGAGGTVLYCGSTPKYHVFHGLDDPTTYAEHLLRKIRKLTDRHLLYRPKPSQHAPRPISGTSFSRNSTLMEALRGCHCLITHGSAAAMDAIIAGVPALVLGGSIARPVAETDIEKIDDPFWPDSLLRKKWLYALAYCQWTNEELRSGEAWEHLKTEILRQGTPTAL